MDAARLSSSGRRPRRGSLERPVNTRLVRNAALVVALPLLLAAFTVGRPGALGAPVLPPSFDGAATTALARELAGLHPSRIPGSAGNAAAADWFAEKAALYGLPVERDTWTEDVPGLGPRALRNAAIVVEGESPAAILFVAHHDNSGVGPGASDDASGVAALLELTRSYAVGATSDERARPRHTLVFLAADAGAFGGLGARRFAAVSRFHGSILAAVVLDALAGPGEPRLELAGEGPRSPAAALVRTAAERVGEQLGEEPGHPGVLRQLVDLGIPFAYGGQAPLLGEGVSAVRLTTADDSGRSDAADRVGALDEALLGRLGRGAQMLLGSLDAGVEVTQGTAPYVYLGTRVLRGWALGLVLVAALVPFSVGVVDLLARGRRRGIGLAPAFRGLAGRLVLWLAAGVLVWLAALAGAFPDGPPVPFPPTSDAVRSWPLATCLGIVALVALLLLLLRRAAGPRPPATPEQELAGYAAALVGLGAVGVLTALVNPYALVFVVPSLYAWLWLPQAGTSWLRDALYGLGLAGPVLGLVSLAGRFHLGLDVGLYATTLVTSGTVPWSTAALVLAWGAVAAQTGAVASGRYAPPAGTLRSRLRAARMRAAQTSRR
jgi:peptidase M28-like protein